MPVTLISQLSNRQDSLRMSLKSKEVKGVESDISKKRNLISDLEIQITNEEKKHSDNIEKRIETLEKQELAKQEKVIETDSLISDETSKTLKINNDAYSANLITQLEALHMLTKWQSNEPGEKGNIREANNAMWWTSILITLLFLVIETAPIAAKLLSPMGEYDLLVESAYKNRLLDQNERFAIMEYNASLKRVEEQNILRAKEIAYRNNHERSRLEGETEREFLRQQVGAQKEVIEEILKKWKEKGTAEISNGDPKNGLFLAFVKSVKKALKIKMN